MRRTTFALLSSIAVLSMGIFSPVMAQTQPAAVAQPSTQALVIIRFNQPRVYFERSLRGAIESALKAKPDVVFDIVHVISDASGAEDKSKPHLAAILQVFREAGIDTSRLQIEYMEKAGLGADEVHIFAR